jgi:5-methylcytosine-specific restriction enzyme subunit McrC
VTQPAIPIENIYYLFCYAWDRFEEAQSIDVGGMQSPDLPNLLARVLLSGTRALLRRGLDRGYQLREDEIATVRGRIDLGGTIALQARNVRRLQCEFDELSHDLHHNRVLKASLKRLARGSMIDKSLSHDLQAIARRMHDVADIWLEKTAFPRVQLHRNNAYYDLLLKVAELAFDCLLPNSNGTGFAFNDVIRDETKMAGVFEAFVRNFYRIEQNEFSVKPLTIAWDGVRIGGATSRLPRMVVDIYLRSDDRRIIIDTKYYANAQQSREGSESFHSGNLYQLFAYLKNAVGQDRSFAKAEGMLLYPCVNVALDETFLIQGHSIKIATVDLAAPWMAIRAQLLAHVKP